MMDKDDVRERLDFADRRRRDLTALNGGDLGGATPAERQQLIQEFFFHLVGATDVLAQLVNEKRGLGLDSEDVSVLEVANKLAQGDAIRMKLLALRPRIKRQPLLTNPYSDDGYLFRLLNYRHQVTHRRRNPFNFNVGIGGPAVGPPATLILDPRDSSMGPSTLDVHDELSRMFDLVRDRCKEILAAL